MDRYVTLPVAGVYCQGPRPERLTVSEAPGTISDADLRQLVDALCASTRGLHLGSGEGPSQRPQYSMNYRRLLVLAARQKVTVPESMRKYLQRETAPRTSDVEIIA